MSKASGLFLILAGLGAAAYAMPSAFESDAAEQAPATEIATIPPVSALRVAAAAPPGVRAEDRSVVAPRPQPAVRPAGPPATAAAPPPAAPVVITLAPRASEPALPAPTKAAAIPDRGSLARELQRELRRVGCYDGEINGAWTAGTKKAMKIFTDRVNATLPIEEPDYILLTLVQGHQDRACGKPCPAEQALSEEGRCVPNAILARSKKSAQPPTVSAAYKPNPPAERPQPAITGWSTTTAAAATAPVQTPEGRMALAGPKAETAPVLDAPVVGHDRRAQPQLGPIPPARVYDRRPPPPTRYVQRSRGDWQRTLFRHQDNLR